MTDKKQLQAELKDVIRKIKIAEKEENFTNLELLNNLAAKFAKQLGNKKDAEKYRLAALEAKKSIRFI